MKILTEQIIRFFQNQGFVVVSSVDRYGSIHNSCKGIVKMGSDNLVYLFDLYRARTYDNLKRNPHISITAVDEHRFAGYCLKGKARIISPDELPPQLAKDWEDRIAGRIARRLLKNIHEEKGHPRHPEALLPRPEYLIVMEVAEAVNLTPHPLRQGE